MTSHAIRIHKTGGPEVLLWEKHDPGAPGAGEVRLAQTAIGLNYIDVYIRTGLYPTTLPSGVGFEAAGVVEAVGPGVTDLKPGDRVAYGTGPVGSYAEIRVMPASHVVKLPAGIEAQARQTMDNIGAVLKRSGLGFGDVVKCTVMLDNMADWPAFNKVYVTYFPDAKFPARSAFGADGLALGALVEIECIAYAGKR